MCEGLQHGMLEEDIELLWRVVRVAVVAGRLPDEVCEAVEIRGIAPSLAVRDRLKETQADQILVRSGAMSVQIMPIRHGLNPAHEARLLAAQEAT